MESLNNIISAQTLLILVIFRLAIEIFLRLSSGKGLGAWMGELLGPRHFAIHQWGLYLACGHLFLSTTVSVLSFIK